jgi:hypothetical protein
MIRPLTCVCLIMAAGSGLYLYQVKQRAFALDASLRSTFHDIDVARERTRMLRADWALVNDPERLQALASQYLTLQPMQPAQLLTMDQLAAALPPPVSVTGKPVPPVVDPDPTHGLPMAETAPPVPPRTQPAAPEVALLPPAEPQPVPPLPALAQAAPVPRFVAAPPKASHHGVRHPAAPVQPPTAQPPTAQPWLATAAATPMTVPRQHHADHHPAPVAAPAPRQFYAANVPAREPAPAPRITPQAATVMYSPSAGGSSLGMASSAALAPPRPLYSTAP